MRNPFLSPNLFFSTAFFLLPLIAAVVAHSPRAHAQAEITTAPITLPGEKPVYDDTNSEDLEHEDPLSAAQQSDALLRNYLELRKGVLYRRTFTQCARLNTICRKAYAEYNTLNDVLASLDSSPLLLMPDWLGYLPTSQLKPAIRQLTLCLQHHVMVPHGLEVDTDHATPMQVNCRLNLNRRGAVTQAVLTVKMDSGPLLVFTPAATVKAQR